MPFEEVLLYLLAQRRELEAECVEAISSGKSDNSFDLFLAEVAGDFEFSLRLLRLLNLGL